MSRIGFFTAIATTLAVTALSPSAGISTAHAQPGAGSGGYYHPAPARQYPVATARSAYHARTGLVIGGTFGLGSMESEDESLLECATCEEKPDSFSMDFHAGWMISPRLALLGEVWVQGQSLERNGRVLVMQSMVMVAGQYWLRKQLWIKGGFGAANLDYQFKDSSGDEVDQLNIDKGAAVMAAIGYEVISSSTFALDISLKVGSGTYENIETQVTTGMIAAGLTWYR